MVVLSDFLTDFKLAENLPWIWQASSHGSKEAMYYAAPD
jgi:hypothetical protein